MRIISIGSEPASETPAAPAAAPAPAAPAASSPVPGTGDEKAPAKEAAKEPALGKAASVSKSIPPKAPDEPDEEDWGAKDAAEASQAKEPEKEPAADAPAAAQAREGGLDVDVDEAIDEEVEPENLAAKSAPPSSRKADDAEHVEEIESAEEIPVDMVSDTPQAAPKKPPPPPPPPKRPPPTTPPGAPAAGAAATPAPAAASPLQPSAPPPAPPATATPAPPPASASAPPPASTPAPSSSPASAPPVPSEAKRKRQKPWWEDLFGDDFIRTLDKSEAKVVRREVTFIEDSLGLEKGAVILDLACGAGSHAVELASRGYSVVGYDLSLAMLARAADEAQERGQRLNFLHGDMRDMAFEETFDGVYCWSTSFGYFDDEKNFNVLQRTHRALRQGGLLLLDIINRDYVAPRQPSLVWFEGDGCVCIDEMHLDFFTSRLRVKRTAMFDDGRSREIDYSIRLYALHEVGKMLHDSGFKVVEVTGHPAHRGVFFGAESARIIVLAERA
jgi:SAM-dependent methyltransferase